MVKLMGKAELLDCIRNPWPAWAPLLDQAILLKPSCLEPIEFRYLRERASWTASEAMRALGVSSYVTVSRWETGDRRIPLPTEWQFPLLVRPSPPLGWLALSWGRGGRWCFTGEAATTG